DVRAASSNRRADLVGIGSALHCAGQRTAHRALFASAAHHAGAVVGEHLWPELGWRPCRADSAFRLGGEVDSGAEPEHVSGCEGVDCRARTRAGLSLLPDAAATG